MVSYYPVLQHMLASDMQHLFSGFCILGSLKPDRQHSWALKEARDCRHERVGRLSRPWLYLHLMTLKLLSGWLVGDCDMCSGLTSPLHMALHVALPLALWGLLGWLISQSSGCILFCDFCNTVVSLGTPLQLKELQLGNYIKTPQVQGVNLGGAVRLQICGSMRAVAGHGEP